MSDAVIELAIAGRDIAVVEISGGTRGPMGRTPVLAIRNVTQTEPGGTGKVTLDTSDPANPKMDMELPTAAGPKGDGAAEQLAGAGIIPEGTPTAMAAWLQQLAEGVSSDAIAAALAAALSSIHAVIAPTPRAQPRIVGSPEFGGELALEGVDFTGNPTSIEIRWFVDAVLVATAPTYSPIAADLEKTVSAAAIATNAYGTSVLTPAVNNVVVPRPALTIVGASPAMIADQPFAFAPQVVGGVPPYRFTGAPTIGLAIDPATGAISGTPLSDVSFTLRVTDSMGAVAEILVGEAQADRWMFAFSRNRANTGGIFNAPAGKRFFLAKKVMRNVSAPVPEFMPHFSAFAVSDGAAPLETVLPTAPVRIEKLFYSHGAQTVQASFAGAPSYEIPVGGDVFASPVAFAVPVRTGGDVTEWCLFSVAEGTPIPPNLRVQKHRGERAWCGASIAEVEAFMQTPLAPSSAELDASYNLPQQPAMFSSDFVVAKGWDGRPVALVFGGSTTMGRQEIAASADEDGEIGFMSVLLHRQSGIGAVPHMHIGSPGYRTRDEFAANAMKRHAIVKAIHDMNGGKWPFTHAIAAPGTADLNTNLATWSNNVHGLLTKIATTYPGISKDRIIASTMIGQVTSSDRYTSLAGQTIRTGFGVGSHCEVINDRLRTNASGLHSGKVIDAYAAWVNPAEAWKWRLTSDYPMGKFAEDRKGTVAPWLDFRFDQAIPLGQHVQYDYTNAAGNALVTAQAPIERIAGAPGYTYSILTASGADIAAGTTVYEVMTPDGINPNRGEHRRMAENIDDLQKGSLFYELVDSVEARFAGTTMARVSHANSRPDLDRLLYVGRGAPAGAEVGRIGPHNIAAPAGAYSIAGPGAAGLAIDAATGMITVADAAALPAAGIHPITIRYANSQGISEGIYRLTVIAAGATDWCFVDPQGGSDANTGYFPHVARATNASRINMRYKRGSTYPNAIRPNSNVNIAHYGDATLPKPVIDAAGADYAIRPRLVGDKDTYDSANITIRDVAVANAAEVGINYPGGTNIALEDVHILSNGAAGKQGAMLKMIDGLSIVRCTNDAGVRGDVFYLVKVSRVRIEGNHLISPEGSAADVLQITDENQADQANSDIVIRDNALIASPLSTSQKGALVVEGTFTRRVLVENNDIVGKYFAGGTNARGMVVRFNRFSGANYNDLSWAAGPGASALAEEHRYYDNRLSDSYTAIGINGHGDGSQPNGFQRFDMQFNHNVVAGCRQFVTQSRAASGYLRRNVIEANVGDKTIQRKGFGTIVAIGGTYASWEIEPNHINAGAPPVVTAEATIAGICRDGETVTVTPPEATGAGALTFLAEWRINGGDPAAGTGASFAIPAGSSARIDGYMPIDEQAAQLSCVVTITDAAGNKALTVARWPDGSRYRTIVAG